MPTAKEPGANNKGRRGRRRTSTVFVVLFSILTIHILLFFLTTHAHLSLSGIQAAGKALVLEASAPHQPRLVLKIESDTHQVDEATERKSPTRHEESDLHTMEKEKHRSHHRSHHPKQHREHPLPASMQRMVKTVRHMSPFVTRQLLDSPRPFSCGGSDAIRWRSFKDVKGIEDVEEQLPLAPPLIRDIADSSIQRTEEEAHCTGGDDSTIVSPSSCHTTNRQRRANEARNNTTCAVVGNSSGLLERDFGASIDSKDIVFRFNSGSSGGFEKHVGTKSSVRIYNGPYVKPKAPGEITVAEVRETGDLEHWISTKKDENIVNAYVLNPELICYAWGWVGDKGKKPSTGFIGVFLAMNMCDSIDVFGFDSSRYFDAHKNSHYYDNERLKKGHEDVHPFDSEKKLLKRLSASQTINLHD